jgi:MFS family permease
VTTTLDRPPSEPTRLSARPSYLVVGTVGYLIYGLGALGPYLRTQLGLSDTEVGLHSTGFAIGLFVSGAIVGIVGRRYGERAVRAAAVILVLPAIVALIVAPSVAVTVLAASALGLGSGTLLGYANAKLAAPGGVLARIRVARANALAMLTAFLCPVALAWGATSGPGWWIGLVPALVLVSILAIDVQRGALLPPPTVPTDGDTRLPRAFWVAWGFLVAAIATEFSIVFWAATLAERRTGVTIAESSIIGSLFLVGMFVGRLGLAVGIGTGHDSRRPAMIGFAVAGFAAVLAWISTAPILTAVACFLAGTGIAVLYPLGVATALATAPGRLSQAGARLNLASGIAILLAPLLLGVISDIAGVVVGWSVIVGLVAIGLALASRLPHGAGTEATATLESAPLA